MTASSRAPRRTLIAASALALLLSATACTPEPAATPSPTPTGFATEEEAFAAAEETYRAYNAAENSSAGDSEQYLTGEALSAQQKAWSELQSAGVRVEGDSRIIDFQPEIADIDDERISVTATVCIDVAGTRVVNSLGEDITPPDREPSWRLEVQFVGSLKEMMISSSTATVGGAC